MSFPFYRNKSQRFVNNNFIFENVLVVFIVQSVFMQLDFIAMQYYPVGHRIQHLFIKSIFQKSLKKNFGKMILFVKTRSNKTKCHWATFSRVASASQILRGFNTNLVLELPYKFLYTEECFSIRFFESTVFILAGFENAIVSRKHYIIHFLKYFNDVAKKAKGLLLACIFKLA